MSNESYIPILKIKRAELTAISQLDPQIKGKILPLFEIEPVSLDPDTDEPDKTYNELLSGFDKKLSSSCSGISFFYIDGLWIDERFIDAGDIYPIENAINQLRAIGMRVVPVSSPRRSQNYLSAIDRLVKDEVCLRLNTIDLANPQLISSYITRLGLPLSSIDVVIDLGDNYSEENYSSGNDFILAKGLINNLHSLHQFRNVSLAGGSFPVDLSNIAIGVFSQNRHEWILWQQLHTSGQLLRPVIYSDYGIQHPNFTRLATRFPSVTASIRYTGNNDFWVFRGKVANQYGYEQYGAHCQAIVAHAEYAQPQFSVGDGEIDTYAKTYAQYLSNPTGNYKFGSPEVWRRIGQNHHITKVVDQLATLYGL